MISATLGSTPQAVVSNPYVKILSVCLNVTRILPDAALSLSAIAFTALETRFSSIESSSAGTTLQTYLRNVYFCLDLVWRRKAKMGSRDFLNIRRLQNSPLALSFIGTTRNNEAKAVSGSKHLLASL